MSDTAPGESSERPDLSGEPLVSVWPPPPGGDFPMPSPTYPVATNAVIILVLGIVSIVIALLCGLGGLLGIAPWIMGNNSLRAIDQGLANPMERGMVNGGRICGIVAVGVCSVGVIFYLVFMAFGYFSSGSTF